MLAGEAQAVLVLGLASIIGLILGIKEERGAVWCVVTVLTLTGSGAVTCISLCSTRETGGVLTTLFFGTVIFILGLLIPAFAIAVAEIHSEKKRMGS